MKRQKGHQCIDCKQIFNTVQDFQEHARVCRFYVPTLPGESFDDYSKRCETAKAEMENNS